MFTGDPIEDMELAKALIARHPDVDLDTLSRIAADRTQPVSARIAAIYTLGFTDDAGVAYDTLSAVANDVTEPEPVRDHAREALDAMPTFREASASNLNIR